MEEKAKKMLILSLKMHSYLKTMQKALAYDEDSKDHFQNTYDEMLDELLRTNWQIHDLAESIKLDSFRDTLLNDE